MDSILLSLSANNMQACNWRSGELSAAQNFADNTAGKEQFAAFLQAQRSPAYLLTDLIEENFRLEAVPHLRGRERTRLLQRKLELCYRNTPFRLALPLRRSSEGRRDDIMLFSALTNPAAITPWLNILLAQEFPLVGIYSVPLISTALIRHISSSHLLLLSWEKHAGLRQSYFEEGQLRFSRLTPISSSKQLAEVAATESARTRHYLKSQGMIPAEQKLDVRMLSHADEQMELSSLGDGSPDTNIGHINIGELSRQLRIGKECADSDATPLYLHLLATSPPPIHYAAAEHRHFYSLLRARHILNRCSASLALACLLWSGSNLMQMRLLSAEIAESRIQTETLSQREQQIIRGFPATLEAATYMKAAVLLTRSLQNAAPPPQRILDGLSTSMDAFPRIRLSSLSWQANIPQKTAATPNPTQVILLNGDLAEFAGDYRDALSYLRNFQHNLAQRGYEVTPLTLPMDADGGGSNVEGNESTARFALQLIWKPLA